MAKKDWEAVDVPEATAEEFTRAVPFKQAFPKQFASWKRGRGRPKAEAPKKHLTLRLDPVIVDRVKALGRGYNGRVEEVLREAVEAGKL